MVPGSEFSCRITNDLPRELAAFSNASGSVTSCHLPRPVFPGVLLTRAGQFYGAIGFDVEPGGTVAITAPMFFCGPNADFQSSCLRQLLQEVLTEAVRREGRIVRFVEPVPNVNGSGLFTGLLSETGFSVRARIVQWTRTTPLETISAGSLLTGFSSTPEVKYEKLSGEVLGSSPVRKKQIASLLREILANTHDLDGLPSPDADELVEDWIRQLATIVVGSRRRENIALCVCVREVPAADPGLVVVRIQYVGVVPEHRCTGLASGLIRCAPGLTLTTVNSDVEHQLRLTAFADVSNRPATHLYQTCGFQIGREFDVWCCDVG